MFLISEIFSGIYFNLLDFFLYVGKKIAFILVGKKLKNEKNYYMKNFFFLRKISNKKKNIKFKYKKLRDI